MGADQDGLQETYVHRCLRRSLKVRKVPAGARGRQGAHHLWNRHESRDQLGSSPTPELWHMPSKPLMSVFEGNSVQRVQHPECGKLTVLIELEEEAHRIVERRVATRARHCIPCAVPILAGSAIPATSAITTAAAAILSVGAEEERAERDSEKRGSDHLSRGFQSLLAT
jgi:hypothetical protein